MPIYDYKCPTCEIEESRIAGVDDQTVLCTNCRDMMSRLNDDDDLYLAYWNKPVFVRSSAPH
jgi:putative FmdB family regulatory protein